MRRLVQEVKLTKGRTENLPYTNKTFRGKLQDDQFRLQRIISYRNDFKPIIKGQILDDPKGAKIIIDFSLSGPTAFFLFIWFGGLIAGIIGIYWQDNGLNSIYIPIVMIVFGYVATTAAFNYETRKSEKAFMEIFDDDEDVY